MAICRKLYSHPAPRKTACQSDFRAKSDILQMQSPVLRKTTEFHPASTTRRLRPRYAKNGYLSDSRFPMVFASFTIKTADGFCSRERQSWNSKEKIFILPFSSPKSLKFS